MKIEIWTWGTGGPFGRELGVAPKRRRRGHTATSIILSEEDGLGEAAHFLIDAGAPCVETISGLDAPLGRLVEACESNNVVILK